MEPNHYFSSVKEIEDYDEKLLHLNYAKEDFEMENGVEKDERGFDVTPNGSFLDEDGNYFNRQGLDKNGGHYDKYGLYNPGPEYDEKKGVYNDEKFLIFEEEENENKTKPGSKISQLKEQEETDKVDKMKYENLENDEDPEDAYDKEEGNNDISYDNNEIEEIYNSAMEINEKENFRGQP